MREKWSTTAVCRVARQKTRENDEKQDAQISRDFYKDLRRERAKRKWMSWEVRTKCVGVCGKRENEM